MGSISNRYGACIGQNTARTVTFTLLASQLDITEPVKIKLASLVVLLVVYRTLQTDVEWTVLTPR